MMLRWLRDRARTRRIGRALYDSIVAQSRAEAFYRALRVPDTVEGRFELVVLHMHLVLERLRREASPATDVSRALIEAFVSDMDDNMREMGIGDLSVPRRVKRTAAALFERSRDYAAAQHAAASLDVLPAALAEHIYSQSNLPHDGPLRLAAYVRDAIAALDRQDVLAPSLGNLEFPRIAVPP
jgi:cytochrome b pre-mRNA-processing protein 3